MDRRRVGAGGWCEVPWNQPERQEEVEDVATIVDALPGKSFAFVVKAGPFGIARWEYRFDVTDDGGCRITETWIDQRSIVGRTLGGPVSGVTDRANHNRAGMETTLERVAAAAEQHPRRHSA